MPQLHSRYRAFFILISAPQGAAVLWKNLQRRSTHLRYFPTFDELTMSVEEGLTFYHEQPEAVKAAIGKTLEHLGDQVAQAA